MLQVSDGTRAIVTKTGYHTTKGALIRDILFPKKIEFFIRDSLVFVAVMLVGVIIIYFITIPKLREAGYTTEDLWIKSLDLFTIAIPPVLPIALTSCILYGVERLTKS